MIQTSLYYCEVDKPPLSMKGENIITLLPMSLCNAYFNKPRPLPRILITSLVYLISFWRGHWLGLMNDNQLSLICIGLQVLLQVLA